MQDPEAQLTDNRTMRKRKQCYIPSIRFHGLGKLMSYNSNRLGNTLAMFALFCILEAAPGRVAAQTGTTPQAITFTSTAPIDPAVGGPSYTVTATGGASGNPVTFAIDAASTAAACTISSSIVSFTGVGTCIVDANQAGNANYQAAPQVQQTIPVGINQPPGLCLLGSSPDACGAPDEYGTSTVETVSFRLVSSVAAGSIGVSAEDPDSGTGNMLAYVTMYLPATCCAISITDNIGVTLAPYANGGYQMETPVGNVDTLLQTMILNIHGVPSALTGRITVALHDQGFTGACSSTDPTRCDKVANASIYIHAAASGHSYEEDEHTIGGTVSGLAGSGLTLQLNGESGLVAEPLPVAANGTFTFSSLLDNGADYTVTVSAQPTATSETCAVSNGNGMVSGGNVSNVLVTCGYGVTAAASGQGTITPAAQTVAPGNTTSFNVVPNTGFEVASIKGDTCTLTQQGTSSIWTSGAINAACAVTVVFADYPSQCGGTVNYSVAFGDYFVGTSLDASHWTANANGGSVSVTNRNVGVSAPNGPAFPYVTSVGSPIPAQGPFSVRWIATYGAVQGAGTGSLALSQGMPPNGSAHGTTVVDGWEDDANGYRVEMLTSASNQIYVYQQLSPQIMQHDVEYCWLSANTEVWVDGVNVNTQMRGADVPRPNSLWFGNSVNIGSNAMWTPFTLYYVEVRALNDEIFSNGFDSL
jgi:hypothetical protein